MNLTYLDTSAFLRALLEDAPDHASVVALLNDPNRRFISSELLSLEAAGAAKRLASEDPSLADFGSEAEAALRSVELVRVNRTVFAAARAIPEVVKTLDAIHIATVELLDDRIDGVLTVDATMTRVLAGRGVRVFPTGAGTTVHPS
ncbi:MAG: PIN domain-containing protein [Micrococcales bacterium]|nr:PIN domain-containing protein [Micrococcales bacterium]